MYAVVSSGGKQYRVEPGSTLIVERLTADAGANITFDRVLLVGDGEAVTVGTPLVSGATVSATVLGEELGPKIIIFKFKQKATYRRRTGHRQHLTRVRIDGITANGKTTSAPEAAPARAAKPAKAKRPTATAEAKAKKAAPKKAAPKKAAPQKAAPQKAARPAAKTKPKADTAKTEKAATSKPAARRRSPTAKKQPPKE